MLKRLNCAAALLLPLLGGLFCGTKMMVGFALLQRGVEIDPTAFGKDQLDELVASGELIPTLKYYNGENNNQEADYATSTRKERSKRVEGVKGWTFVFDKSNCFQNELNKLDNSDWYTIVPILEDGSGVFNVKSNGKLTGFDAKLFVGIYDIPLTADVTGANVQVDLTPDGTARWQSSADVFMPDEFRFDEITPVAGLRIELDPIVDGATSITATITGLCSGNSIVGLTDMANWKIGKDGVLSAPSAIAYNATTKKYSFTTTAVDAGTEVQLLTSADGNPVYVKDTAYYSGQSQTLTVV
ncbi:hypothetical protein J2X97_000331 [Epilithonimonas hungarica]|uniref:hypothetical protein n=1 Tax=Epilithonimonas hungarica TaxID=454006 RepID=UPI00277D833B|nr:hypothetical protein [Epilithonimonas hungarica]MDP9954694.1 hypothetical protein [Epilithonimonas hungarica]